MIPLELQEHAGESPGGTGSTLQRAFPPAHWPNRRLSRMIEAGGRRWHVQEAGSGEPLLLIHGTGASTHSYRDLVPLLAGRFHVLAFDLPGHGFTEWTPGERLSLSRMSEAVHGLLARAQFSPAYVVGHSAGTAIALRMALERRISPASMIGLNAALMPFGGAWRGVISPVTRLLAASGAASRFIAGMAKDPGAIRRMISSTGSYLDDDGAALYRELFLRPGHAAAVLSMMANWDLGGMVAELPRLNTKLSLLAAGRDLAVPPAQLYQVAESRHDIDVIMIDDGGHLVHEEQPERVARLVERALIGCSGEIED